MTIPEDVKICRCCRTRRENHGQQPRIMIPVFMVNDDEDPVYMCPSCDGDALDSAKELESQRMSDA